MSAYMVKLDYIIIRLSSRIYFTTFIYLLNIWFKAVSFKDKFFIFSMTIIFLTIVASITTCYMGCLELPISNFSARDCFKYQDMADKLEIEREFFLSLRRSDGDYRSHVTISNIGINITTNHAMKADLLRFLETTDWDVGVRYRARPDRLSGITINSALLDALRSSEPTSR